MKIVRLLIFEALNFNINMAKDAVHPLTHFDYADATRHAMIPQFDLLKAKDANLKIHLSISKIQNGFPSGEQTTGATKGFVFLKKT